MGNYGDIAICFLRVDEKNKILTGEQYELVNTKGERTGIFTEAGEFGQHRIEYHGIQEDAYNIIVPDFVREDWESINSYDDVEALRSKGVYSIEIDNWDVAQIDINVPVVLEQVTTVPGYEASNIVLFVRVYYRFYHNSYNNSTSKSAEIWISPVVYSYNKEVNQVDSYEDLIPYQVDIQDYEDQACLNTDEQGKIIINDYDSCTLYDDFNMSLTYALVPYFVAKKETTELEIENTVNGLTKYNASKDKELHYEIKVTNKGSVTSYNNVITTYVPSRVLGVSSEVGEYDESNHTITWEIDEIAPGESKNLTYDAKAPGDTNGEELIGYTVVRSDQVEGETLSANTIVTLDRIIEVIHNPDTGTMVYIANTNIGMPLSCLIVVTILICMMFAICIKKYKFLKK